MDTGVGKKQQTPHFIPKNHHQDHRPTKRPRPAASSEGANKRRITVSPRVDDIRLILESTAADGELAMKIDRVEAELQAVDGALSEGSLYLGIVDKGELKKRGQLLEKKCKLLKEERELLQSLRAELAEEERIGTERVEPRAPSSPALRRSTSDNAAAAAAAAAAASPQQPPPSLQIQTSAPPTSPPAAKRTFSYPPLSPPAGSKGDANSIGDFLKRNAAAVAKKAGAAAGRSDAAGHGS
eukprot:g4296.t1